MGGITSAAGGPAVSGRASAQATWLPRLRAAHGYDSAVRAVGCAWFLLLALTVGLNVSTRAQALGGAGSGPAEWAALLANLCLFAFYLVLCWAMLHRSSPTARTDSVLPSVIGFVGSYLPWTVVLFAPGVATEGRNLASAALLLTGTVLMVVVVCHLGRCFSIVPQARKLVRTGPYAVIRHPLYLVEEIALLGILLQYFSFATLALFLAHAALQVRRILYEENLLRRSFPDYDAYAESTSRLIPYVW